jgi:glyoxylase-like metal-dependent hydrolase (beta-lactamase superfamily II)
VALTGIAPGLRRWTAWHEEWEQEVGCLAAETDDGLVLIDPLDAPGELSQPEHVLLTVHWHGRSAQAPHVWAHRRTARLLANRGVELTHPIDPGSSLPGGITALETARRGEVVYWLPQQKAVAVGDVLLGAGAKPRDTGEPLRLCPERWLGKATHADLRESLAPLLELPVESVLVSHGEPVLGGGADALASVLAG